MRIKELIIENSPAVGDVLAIEVDNTLIEASIVDIMDNDIVVHLDETALTLLINAKKKLNESVNKSELSETGAPAPHRLNPEPDYAMTEAEYQGRKVTLGKPFLTPDGPKKRSVYVKNSKGNVIKVNFGQKGVKIKKGIPARRKSFRARHNCATAKDRTTPRYWSCKFW